MDWRIRNLRAAIRRFCGLRSMLGHVRFVAYVIVMFDIKGFIKHLNCKINIKNHGFPKWHTFYKVMNCCRDDFYVIIYLNFVQVYFHSDRGMFTHSPTARNLNSAVYFEFYAIWHFCFVSIRLHTKQYNCSRYILY